MREDEIKSKEISWEYMLNRFWCSRHMAESVIVNRGPGVFVLACGCAYIMNDVDGVKWINTTAPSTESPNSPSQPPTE
jgi:hypothetical protein